MYSMVMWQTLLASGATFGFAVLFNAPPHVLPVCAAVGGAAFLARFILTSTGVSVDVATLLGSMLVGLLAELAARRFLVPALVFKVTGFIPFLRGVLAYQTVLDLLDDNYVAGLGTGVQAVIRAGAIAGGIGTVTALFRLGKGAVPTTRIR